ARPRDPATRREPVWRPVHSSDAAPPYPSPPDREGDGGIARRGRGSVSHRADHQLLLLAPQHLSVAIADRLRLPPNHQNFWQDAAISGTNAGTSMDKRSCLAIILAAGEGKRMRSAMPKVMHRIGGLPMIGHVLVTA